MSSLEETKVFNNNVAIIEGWYWVMPSRNLKKGRTKSVSLMAKNLVVYRGEDNRVRLMDAYCPHMGAHLAEGSVQGNDLRCFFHHWKFDEGGQLIDIPCRKKVGLDVKVKTYPVEEKFGLIWAWTGDAPKNAIPCPPDLEGVDVDFIHGNPFVKECHPNVVMINAIDANHFQSVHRFPTKLFNLEARTLSDNCVEFVNQVYFPWEGLAQKISKFFWKEKMVYSLAYFYGNVGTVTTGFDFLRFYIMFAIRPNDKGEAEGQTVLITKKRKGLFGKIFNFFILRFTRAFGNYFAKGDTEVFRTIKFSFQNPLPEDKAIIQFIQHVEKQPTCKWGFSDTTQL